MVGGLRLEWVTESRTCPGDPDTTDVHTTNASPTAVHPVPFGHPALYVRVSAADNEGRLARPRRNSGELRSLGRRAALEVHVTFATGGAGTAGWTRWGIGRHKRRTFLSGVYRLTVAAAGLAAIEACGLKAASPEAPRVPHVGVLAFDDGSGPRWDAFRRGLRELGWIEARNLTPEWRLAEAHQENLPSLALELINLPCDILVAGGTQAAAVRKGLRELGYVEGQTLAIKWRFARAGTNAQFHEMDAELVRLPVDVLVAYTTVAARAAKDATHTIPIVAVSVGLPVPPDVAAQVTQGIQ
jgi:hypothetical protein